MFLSTDFFPNIKHFYLYTVTRNIFINWKISFFILSNLAKTGIFQPTLSDISTTRQLFQKETRLQQWRLEQIKCQWMLHNFDQ